jgi:hypothetical protein
MLENINNYKKRKTIMTEDITAGRQFDTWRPLSWSAIFLGAILALAISASLHILGIGVTANLVDTNNNASDALITVGGVSGIWFLVATAISLFIGGFVASSLGHAFSGGRATIYGLGVWALTTLVSIVVIGPALISGAGSAVNTAGTVVDRTARVIGSAGNAVGNAAQNAPSGLLDSVERTLIGTTSGQIDQGATQEIKNLIGQRIYQGSWTPQQREQLTNAIAKAANIPADDARRRVDEAQNTITSAMEQASAGLKRAAETARVALAGTAYWAFASMLVGFIAAFFGARAGELDEKLLPAFARLGYHREHVETHT